MATLDLYYWPTPNAHKITILLEELGLAYEIRPINLAAGAQFDPAFLAISPNNRVPALVDNAPADGGAPIALFESGAIMTYLAEKTGRFLPTAPRARAEVLSWLFWQMSGVGPMFGQAFHFIAHAPEHIPYAVERYTQEADRLLSVLDQQLSTRDYVAGDYSIADMAIFPWIKSLHKIKHGTDAFTAVQAWVQRLKERPAITRAYAHAALVAKPAATAA